jgi:hypothetical protein
MSQQNSKSPSPTLSAPSSAPAAAPKALTPRDQEFVSIVKELKNGTIAGFVRRINVGSRGADNPDEVALKTEVGNALAAMRKNCGSDEQFARLVQEMVDILVNVDKETLQIKAAAQKKISELKEQCARENSGRGKRSEVPEKKSEIPEKQETAQKVGVLKSAYLKSKEAVFNAIPPELRLPSKEEFERIDALSPADLAKYETALLGDEKKLKKFLHAWQVGGLDKPWKDYVAGAHPESAKRLDNLYARAVKMLGGSSLDNFTANFNKAREGQSRAAEVTRLSASILKDAEWLESTFKKGIKSGILSKIDLAEYGLRGDSYKASILEAIPKIENLEKQLTALSKEDSDALKQIRALKHAVNQIQ